MHQDEHGKSCLGEVQVKLVVIQQNKNNGNNLPLSNVL